MHACMQCAWPSARCPGMLLLRPCRVLVRLSERVHTSLTHGMCMRTVTASFLLTASFHVPRSFISSALCPTRAATPQSRLATDPVGNEYMVMEYVKLGSLNKLLMQFGDGLRTRQRLAMCEQVWPRVYQTKDISLDSGTTCITTRARLDQMHFGLWAPATVRCLQNISKDRHTAHAAAQTHTTCTPHTTCHIQHAR